MVLYTVFNGEYHGIIKDTNDISELSVEFVSEQTDNMNEFKRQFADVVLKSDGSDPILNKKIESGTLYYKTMTDGRAICGRCNYRGWRTNTCRKFMKQIKRVQQTNGGFHHLPCAECLNYKLTEQDINYIKRCYEYKRSKK